MTRSCRTRGLRPRRRGGFQPPHCPNPACPHHARRDGWHYVKNGRKRDTNGHLRQEYRCRACGRYFCARTFSPDYWLKRRRLFRAILAWAVEGPGLRQIGRHYGVSHSTVARHFARAARHCLLFHQRLIDRAPALQLREPAVLDGFESFAYSQYFPFHVNLATGGKSTFIYGFNDAPLRRKGTMTPFQRRRRAELEATLGRPDPKAVEKAFGALVAELFPRLPAGAPLALHSDDHPAYRRALRRLRRAKDTPSIHHRITSSRARRTRSNPLFPVNLADLRIRNGQANHRRQTIAFSKHLQAVIDRMAVFTVWSNCIKKKSENHDEETAAMEVGLLQQRLSWKQIFRGRLFPRHVELGARWRTYYERRVESLVYRDRLARQACQYAF